MQDLRKAFQILDTNKDGMLSKQELSIGFQRIYNSAQEAEEQVEKIFSKCDIDGSGNIDYSEWVVATIDKKRLLTTEKL